MVILDFYPLLVLIGIQLLIIFRRIGSFEIPTWIAFLIGAIFIIMRSPDAYHQGVDAVSKQADVFIFLFGIFVIVTALDISGALDEFAIYLIEKSKNDYSLLFFLIFGFGLLSSILLNDTIAILAPVILIAFGKRMNKEMKPFIIVLAITVSFGSAMTPIGNPQNFLLTINGSVGFLNFIALAMIPTIIALGTTYVYMKIIWNENFNHLTYSTGIELTPVLGLENLKRRSAILFFITLPIMAVAPFFNIPLAIPILIAGSILLFVSPERNQIIEKLDWTVMILFAGMFTVVDAVVRIQYFQDQISKFAQLELTAKNLALFLIFIFILSQLISNVPAAILASSLIGGTNFDTTVVWILTAITATFAGSSSMMGAASNFIVVETSKKRNVNITWWDLTKIGFPLSIVCLLEIIIYGIVLITFI